MTYRFFTSEKTATELDNYTILEVWECSGAVRFAIEQVENPKKSEMIILDSEKLYDLIGALLTLQSKIKK